MNKNYRFEVRYYDDLKPAQYVVEYFDVPVGGQGNTLEDAILEAQENLEEYLSLSLEEHIKVPEPSVAPKLNDLSGKLTLRVSKTLHKRIIERAEKENVSINALLNEAIATYLA